MSRFCKERDKKMPEGNEFFDPSVEGQGGEREREDPFCVIDADIQEIRDGQGLIKESLLDLVKADERIRKTLIFDLVLVGIFMLVLSYVFMTEINSLRAQLALEIQRRADYEKPLNLTLEDLKYEFGLATPKICLDRMDRKIKRIDEGMQAYPVSPEEFLSHAACAINTGATEAEINLRIDKMLKGTAAGQVFGDYGFFRTIRSSGTEQAKTALRDIFYDEAERRKLYPRR